MTIKMMCGVTDFHWVVPESFPKCTKGRLFYFAVNFIIIFVFLFEKISVIAVNCFTHNKYVVMLNFSREIY